jgi:transcriptional regulator GlxA family with amidase domain
MTVRVYQTKRRVDVAIEMLRASDEKVFTVAQAVGWASRKDLNRALRRYAGATPATIRDLEA